jgi:hypothetical protein
LFNNAEISWKKTENLILVKFRIGSAKKNQKLNLGWRKLGLEEHQEEIESGGIFARILRLSIHSNSANEIRLLGEDS